MSYISPRPEASNDTEIAWIVSGSAGVLLEPTVASPSAPSSGYMKLYFKSDGNLYKKNSSGVEAMIGSGAMASALLLDQTSSQTIINGQPIWNTLTASELVATDASKKFQSLAVATYPSLAELAYVKGVTSSIQNQINAKGTGNVTKVGTPADNQIGVWTGDGTIEGDADLTFDGDLLSAKQIKIVGTAGAGYLDFTAQASNPTAPAAGIARIHAVTNNGFTRIEQDNEGTTNITFGRDSVIIVKNDSGGALALGDVVYIKGVATSTPTVGKAKADSINTLPALGLVMDAVADGGFTRVMRSGLLTMNTSAFSATDKVYVSAATAGALTATRPSGTTNCVQRIGTILTQGASGIIEIEVSPSVLNMETGTNAATWTGSAIVGTTIQANTGFVPDANDGAYLGVSGTAFSDLFLASGGVIDWLAGAATITHSANTLTFGGSAFTTLALGTTNITMTGSISATGSRVTKGWFTDIESTNMPTVGGTAILSSLTAPQFTTIELGHASDTTLARVSAGVVSIEGVNILTVAGGTLTGNIVLGENTSIQLDPAGSADGKYTGTTKTGVAGATVAFGDLITLDKDDSRWELVDISVAAAATGDARGILGMAVSAGNDGDTITILLDGIIRADANFPALTIGAPVYASTAGDIVVAQPTTTDYVIRIVGSALTADEIFFRPDFHYTTHT